jgi:hypothetical protein
MTARYLLAAVLIAVTAAGTGYDSSACSCRSTTRIGRSVSGLQDRRQLLLCRHYDLAAYLIATNDGLILINSGVPGSYRLMKTNIEQLGLRSPTLRSSLRPTAIGIMSVTLPSSSA